MPSVFTGEWNAILMIRQIWESKQSRPYDTSACWGRQGLPRGPELKLGAYDGRALDSVLISVYSSRVTSLIVIDWSVDEPVYAQIARQIRAQIASGELIPGTLLPPVRTIASDLGVNLNTVARAYRLLEAEGFVGIEHREGVRVLAPARRADRGAIDELGEELSVLIARMRQAGLSPAEIRRRVERELGERS